MSRIDLPAGPAVDEGASPGGAETDRANALALAYRAGRTDLLPELFEALRPILMTALGRFGRGRRPLPASIDSEDLIQQTWIILDNLARLWQPELGDFGAYVRTSYGWALWRYVRTQLPGRGSLDVHVERLEHDVLVELLDRLSDQPGIDGQSWDEQLIVAEALDELDPFQRRAFLMRVLEGRPFDQIGELLGIARTTAYRDYRRALDRLRLLAGLDVEPPGELERLVQALHEGAGRRRQLPSRAWVCARAGLSEVRFARLMSQLVERGCVVGRTARHSGRLVHTSPVETLAHAAIVEASS